ncbi:hypothetical protein MBLNU457_4441t2 [Dothideomycetes sp. NU457]
MEGTDSQPQSPFIPMFETFRAELDEHHDRRERCIKASRDITASSKKIIFTLQRVRKLNQALPPHVTKNNAPYRSTIETQYASVSSDLQGINTHRYARNISGGTQEFMEAVSFEHYLTTGSLLTYADARAQLEKLGGENGPIDLTVEDYILGIYDMTGELMRFAITAMATDGKLPSSSGERVTSDAEMDVDSGSAKRDVLTDLRALRAGLEALDVGHGPFARDAEKKMDVMRSSVEKVERALYGLVIRGRERPKGWMPDTDTGHRREIDVEA